MIIDDMMSYGMLEQVVDREELYNTEEIKKSRADLLEAVGCELTNAVQDALNTYEAEIGFSFFKGGVAWMASVILESALECRKFKEAARNREAASTDS
jgi:hypothetical protein